MSGFVSKINAEAYLHDLKRQQEAWDTGIVRILDRVASVAYAQARTTTMFKDKTGALRRSISAKRVGKSGVFIKASAKHAGFVENGTRPHPIVPKGKRLAFTVNGSRVFARKVNHPGTAPRPFIQQAAKDANALMKVLVAELVHQTLGA